MVKREHEGEFWRWVEAPVDQSLDHLRLVHDEHEGVVALVGPPSKDAFGVQFLLDDDRGDPTVGRVLADVRHDLDFYLLEVGGPNAWGYAIYHCGKMANAYGSVHWGFCPSGTKQSERWGGIPQIEVEENPFGSDESARIFEMGDDGLRELVPKAPAVSSAPKDASGHLAQAEAERHRLEFLPGVAHRLGWYVYALRDPRDGSIFYIGKGVGNRAYQHARRAIAPGASVLDPKRDRIRAIHDSGCEVTVEIVRHQLPDERGAYEVEAAVIDAVRAVGHEDLKNRVGGHGRDKRGWSSLDGLQHLAAPKVDIPAQMRPSLLIRPRENYRYGMDEPEMWEVTRQAWKIRRRDYKFVFCVHEAIIRGVWRVIDWDPESDWRPRKRRGFLGEPAWDLWSNYVGGHVGHLLPAQGGRIPFTILR